MFGSPILDIAIGMAFIYLLLSLIVSAFQEILASIIQSRAANLQRGLRSLFSGDCLNNATTLVDSLYQHGLIRGLYQDPKKDYGLADEPKWTNKWRTVFGEIRLGLRWLLHMAPPGEPSQINDLLLPAYIPARTFALALRDIMNNPTPFGWDSMRNIELNLTELRQKYPKNKAVEGLLALVLDSARRPEKLQANLENWYNDAMDRVSGWYKRYVQNILLFIGLGIAVVLNVDSVRIARTLWFDKDIRGGLSNAASEYLTKHHDPAPKTAAPTAAAPTSETPFVKTNLQSQLQGTVDAFNDVTQKSLLPVGWRHSPAEYWAIYHNDKGLAARKLIMAAGGWLITAIALSLGAPFWFDTLNKFMVVRSTIKPQEKSQTERSKDN